MFTVFCSNVDVRLASVFRSLSISCLVGCLAAACVAPRSVAHSGRVTPQGELLPALEMVVNVPTGTSGALIEGLKTTVDNLIKKEDRLYERGFDSASKAAIA